MKCYEILDESGIHRLRLHAVSRRWDRLIWERKEAAGWALVLAITSEAFQLGDGTRRFIDELYSFSPETALAIIKVGQGDAPQGTGLVNFNYSWLEWDLRCNRMNRVLRICADIEEPYVLTS